MKKFLYILPIIVLAFCVLTTNTYAYDTTDFVITVKTDNTGTSNDGQFKIPTTGSGYHYSVDCENDGSWNTTNHSGDYTCDYGPYPGTYTVVIHGTFPRIYFNNEGDKDKILTIEQWGTNKWTSMENAFYGCSNLKMEASDTPDLSGVTDMQQMFENATNLQNSTGTWAWNTSTINNMREMFIDATGFNGDISSWTVSNVTNFSGMFYHTAFNQDISSWIVSNGIDFSRMFDNTPFNQDISGWDFTTDASKNITLRLMFDDANSFNQNISGWNTVRVTDMSAMFQGASSFNQNISGWNISNVTNMSSMFNDADSFNQDISGWNTSNVTGMAYMFASANAFNQNIGSWDVSHVTSMSDMLRDLPNFNQDLSNWVTSSVTNMDRMFLNTNSFDQNIGSWDVSHVTSMSNMFNGDTLSIDNYDSLLKNWNTQSLQSSVNFHAGYSKYCAVAAHNNLTSATGHKWTITDGGMDASCPPEITSNGGGDTASISVDENQTDVTTVVGVDPNIGDTVTYAFSGGDDQAQFNIDATTGKLTFKVAPDYENPTDANGDNVYKVDVTAMDQLGHADSQNISVTVTNVTETTKTPIYRLYNKKTGTQLYTRGVSDRDKILNKYKCFEFTDGVPAFYASTTNDGTTPMYRLYNKKTGAQLYTRGKADRDKILNKYKDYEFTDGSPSFYASMTPNVGLTPMFRLYNTKTGMQLYTRGIGDRDKILNKYKDYEFTDGVPAFYAKIN
jgi:surface protein